MPGRKQTRQQQSQRREQLNAMRREQTRRERRRRLIWNGVIAGTVVLLGAGLTALGLSGGSHATPAIKGVQSFSKLSRNHVTTPVKYAQNPPVGGNHNPRWLNCGIYTSPVPNENAVHDLEHGAVWITYRPDLATQQVNQLSELVRSYKTYVTLSPYPGLTAPVVASAWGKQLRLQTASDPRLRKFLDVYRTGPQDLEPGAPCNTGGVGTPSQ